MQKCFCEWFLYKNFANDEFACYLHSEDQRRNWRTLCGDGDLIVREQLQGVQAWKRLALYFFVFTLAVLGASVCLNPKQMPRTKDTVHLQCGGCIKPDGLKPF